MSKSQTDKCECGHPERQTPLCPVQVSEVPQEKKPGRDSYPQTRDSHSMSKEKEPKGILCWCGMRHEYGHWWNWSLASTHKDVFGTTK